MTALAERLADLVMPWSDVYDSSSAVELVVVFLHLGGLLVGGGVAFALDRAVLHPFRSAPGRRGDLVREMDMAHRVVLGGLIAMTLSGVALTAADPTVFLVSRVYWVKIGLVVLLVANGWWVERLGRRLSAAPQDEIAFRRLRGAAVRSMALWGFVVLLGIALTVYV